MRIYNFIYWENIIFIQKIQFLLRKYSFYSKNRIIIENIKFYSINTSGHVAFISNPSALSSDSHSSKKDLSH